MSSSIGMLTFPTEWEKTVHVPNHQPVKDGFQKHVTLGVLFRLTPFRGNRGAETALATRAQFPGPSTTPGKRDVGHRGSDYVVIPLVSK